MDGSEAQLWTLDATFKDGYFTLKNPKSGGYLTATSSNSTSIEGNQNIGSQKLDTCSLRRQFILLEYCHALNKQSLNNDS